MKVTEKYLQLCNTPSDINEHLPTLRRYAAECQHVTEMGFRWGCSTYALLDALPTRLISYDIVDDPEVRNVTEAAIECGVNFDFIQANVLDVDIDETDLLFMDTFHHFLQIRRELERHARRVRKYLIFHDTTTFESVNESIASNVRPLLDPIEVRIYEEYPAKGIMPAINNFLADNPQWVIKERFTNNNGLLILEKK